MVISGAGPGLMAAALARMAARMARMAARMARMAARMARMAARMARMAARMARMAARMARMATSSLPETQVGRAHGRCWRAAQRSPMLILMIRGAWNLSTCGGSGT